MDDYNWKAVALATLIQKLNYKSYLELGVDKGHTFNQIVCDKKVGVDPCTDIQGVVKCTTDEYFSAANDTFDLIYIDACHEKNQVLKDFNNSYSRLNKNGIIAFHDICPNCPEDTSMNGCGNVYELWMMLCENYKVHIIQKQLHEGVRGFDAVGFLVKKENDFIPLVMTDRGYEYYDSNRKLFVEDVKINLDDLIRIAK